MLDIPFEAMLLVRPFGPCFLLGSLLSCLSSFSHMLFWTFVEHFGTTLAHSRFFGIGRCYAGRGQTTACF